MYTVIVLTADYEGWWLFDGYESDIKEQYTFECYDEMIKTYNKLYAQYELKYPSKKQGKYNIPAFFSCCEIEYCDDCDDDVQIYHSLLAFKDDQIITIH